MANGKPQYRTLVKALDKLCREVHGSVLNACSPEEIADSYRELYKASVNAGKLITRARATDEKDSLTITRN